MEGIVQFISTKAQYHVEDPLQNKICTRKNILIGFFFARESKISKLGNIF